MMTNATPNAMPTNELEAKVKHLEDESELLLLQSHLVQEELERYFSLYQQSEQRIAELTSRAKPRGQAQRRTNAPLTSLMAMPISKISKVLGWKIKSQVKAVRASGLFDEKWYLQRYPDVAKDGADPIKHYLLFGASEARNPGPNFDTQWYIQAYPDVAASKINPLFHYIKFGRAEGRRPRRGMEGGAAGLETQVESAQPGDFQLDNIIRARDEHERVSKERLASNQMLIQERDRQKIQLAEREAQIQELKQALSEHERVLAERLASIVMLTQKSDRQNIQLAEREVQIQQLMQARDEQAQLAQQRDVQLGNITRAHDEYERVSKERLANIEQLTHERDRQNQQLDERGAQIQQLTQERNQQNVQLAEWGAQIQQLTQERNQQNVQLAEWKERIWHLQQDSERLNGTVGKLSEELLQARQTANLATKIQVLRESDLRDLQSRYKEAVSVQDEQHQLMLQLEEKLRLASQYFHQLRNNTASPVEAATESAPLLKPSRRRVAAKQKRVNKG